MNNYTIIILSLSGALLSGIGSAVTAYLLPHMPWLWQVLGGTAVLLLVVYLVLDRASLGQLFSKRNTRYGLNAVAMAIIGLGITIFANLIAKEHDWRKDFTKNQLHTLSDQTVKVLKGLNADINVKLFVDPRQKEEYEETFRRYTYYTSHLKPEVIDFDKDPRIVQQYKVKQIPVFVLESKDRTARIENLMGTEDPKIEEKITNAIIKVSKGDKKKIYFVAGHGEHSINDNEKGYSEIKNTLESGRYDVQELPLVQKDKVPADAELLVIPGPKTAFLEHELKQLDDYIRGGGKVLFLIEPDSTPTLKPLLSKLGVEWKPRKTIFELNPLQQRLGPLIPIVTSFDTGHEITKDMVGAGGGRGRFVFTVFPLATPLEKSTTPPENSKITSLFSTSPVSFEVDLAKDIRQTKMNEKTDRKGPLTLGLAVAGPAKGEPTLLKKEETDKQKADEKAAGEKTEEKKPEYRVVVIGDSDFAANGSITNGVNSDLFQNSLSWLSQEEDLISIRPKPTDTRELTLSETGTRIIRASVYSIPLLLFFAGIGVWLKRRKR